MNQARVFVGAGIGLALAAMGWLVPVMPFSNLSADMVSRSVGVALLGIALVAAGLVLRAAMRAEEDPASATIRPQATEYRCGFGSRVLPAKRQATQSGIVVALRRAVTEQTPAVVDGRTAPPMIEIERLQDMLRNRTAQTLARNGDSAKCRDMRSAADQHGLAPR